MLDFKEKIIVEVKSIINLLEGRNNELAQSYTESLKISLQSFNLNQIQYCISRIINIYDETYTRNDNAFDVLYKQMADCDNLISQNIGDYEKVKEYREKLFKLWTAFDAWFQDELSGQPPELIRAKFVDSYYDFNQEHFHVSINLQNEAKKQYGENLETITAENAGIELIKKYIEMLFANVVEVNQGRLTITVKVNELFRRFNLPYKLQKGKITQTSYKTSETIEKIVNYEQLERKIRYTEEMIIHNEFIDKHSALCYITDALDYFISLFKGKDGNKTYSAVAKSINADENTKVYAVIKEEIGKLKAITNDYFDIRHNELQSATKDHSSEKREPLTDKLFVEYLYNRIYALLYLLRIKKDKTMVEEKVEFETDILEISDDDLPF